MAFKILFSNIGYARGIDGSLWQHICRFNRHFYCSIPLQQKVLIQVRDIMHAEKPDLCCFVEVDQGSYHSDNFNQINFLRDDDYRYFDVAEKYGPNSWLGRMPLHIGKSSAFVARQELAFERRYFSSGSKRLIHEVSLPDGIRLFFTHFSLHQKVRARQFREMRKLVEERKGPVIVLADFNIMRGFSELGPLLQGTDLKVLNRETDYTFTLHRMNWALDLCLYSAPLDGKLSLQIVPQPFSDHAALLVKGNW
jgi:endonuclease/exonuclease/phosphatase family metal-dependent hydrolase